MKIFQKSLFLLLFLIFSCNSEKKDKIRETTSGELFPEGQGSEGTSSTEDNTFVIKDKSAGEFRIGTPIPTSLETFSITKEQQIRTTEEGPTEETVYGIKDGNKKILEILPAIELHTGEKTQNIGEIRITSEKFRTEKGIGVNSTLEEFWKKYPQSRIWYTYVSDRYVLETEEVDAQFLLAGKDFIGEMEISSAMTPLQKEDFKEGARIEMIRIFQ